MDPKILLSTIAIAMLTLFLIYEWVKEKNKNKKDSQLQKEQTSFYKSIGAQLTENSIINKELLKYLKISTEKYVEEVTESQVRITIDSILQNSQNEMIKYTTKILKENHIKGNEKEIVSKIKLFIDNQFHKDSLFLKEFKYKGISVGSIATNEWKDILIEGVIDCVLKEKEEKTLLGIIQNLYDGFRYDLLNKILSHSF